MQQTKKKNFQWAMLPVIFTLAWPTMLEQLLETAVQYIDTAMVGSLGTEATAAVGATATIGWLINGTLGAVGVGFLAYIARARGAGEDAQARRAVSQAVLAVLVCGTLFTGLALSLSSRVPVWMQVDPKIREICARYFFILYLPTLLRTAIVIFGTVLRAAGDTKTPMRVGLLVNGTNVVLNFLLIYPTRPGKLLTDVVIPGAGLGVIGAAIASAAAYALGGIMMTRALWKHPLLSPRGQSFRPDPEVLRPCLKIALPNMLQRFFTFLGYVVFAAMINSLGELSTAAHTIANTVESAFYIPGFGMQQAAATLTGNSLGAQDRERMRGIAGTLIVSEVALMLLSGALLFAFAPGMMGVFSKSAEVILLGSTVLRMVAVSEPFFGVSIIIEGILQGVGSTMRPFIYNISGMWAVRIAGTFLCTQIFDFGLVSAWACMIAHNLLLFALFLVHYLRGRWNPLNQ